MSNRRPENYTHILTRAVDLPIILTESKLKFWIRFYGLTSAELKNEHIRTAMARRGVKPGEYDVASPVWDTAA